MTATTTAAYLRAFQVMQGPATARTEATAMISGGVDAFGHSIPAMNDDECDARHGAWDEDDRYCNCEAVVESCIRDVERTLLAWARKAHRNPVLATCPRCTVGHMRYSHSVQCGDGFYRCTETKCGTTVGWSAWWPTVTDREADLIGDYLVIVDPR